MIKISVVCSVFNTEKYLNQCFKSIENQTMSEKDYEFIIINDGSTDKSLSIINKYVKKHFNWKLINQENRGLGFARNEGLKICLGKYITFLDSDDYLNTDALINMYNEIESNKCNIAIFKCKTFNSTNEWDDYYTPIYEKLPKITSLKKTPILTKTIRSVAILYESNIAKNTKFIENVIHEDGYYCLSCYNKASKILVSKNYVYMIRIREGQSSSIMQNLNYKTFLDHVQNMKKADLEIKNSILIEIHINSMINYINKNIKKSDEIKKAFFEINKFLNEMQKDKILSPQKKLIIKIKIILKKIYNHVRILK